MLRATLSTTIRAARTRSTGTAHGCIAIPLGCPDDDASVIRARRALEHDAEKWVPVFGKTSCSSNNLERDGDSKKSHHALALLWQILRGMGFPNQFFSDSWVVGFWRGRRWLAGHRIGKRSLDAG